MRTADVLSSTKTWSSLLLPQHVEVALREAGFSCPSPVQEAALPLARLGADLIVQAKAGTGKTLVFAVPAVERVDLGTATPQVLVLAPTREIALQASEAVGLAAACLPPPGLSCGTFIGGLPVEEDEKQLRRACHVAVGTTGRILSLIERGVLRTGAVRMLVLDEADKLLGDSFRQDTLAILEAVPKRRQLLALSATFAPAALDQLRGLMGGRQQEVLLCADDTSLLGVRQCYKLLPGAAAAATEGAAAAAPAAAAAAEAHMEARLAALLQLLGAVSFQQAVVFCKYKSDAEAVAERLRAAGYPATHLSAQKTQLQRIEALNALRDFRLRVAVTTDLAARGVDLDRVNLVANLELPGDAATYMHRVGRAGRFGTRGLAVTLLEGPAQLARLQGYLEEVAGGQVFELPEEVPEDWYRHPGQQPPPPQQQQQQQQQQQASPAAAAMGPATPPSGGSSPVASAPDSLGGSSLLGDIATASLWGGAMEPAQQAPAAHQPWGEPDVDLSYEVVPKPTQQRAPVAAAPVAAPDAGASGSGSGLLCSPTSGKPLVSSLTAAVAAAEAAAAKGAPAAAAAPAAAPAAPAAAVPKAASAAPAALLAPGSNGVSSSNGHLQAAIGSASSVSSVDSWASTSDDSCSSDSDSDSEGTAAAAAVPGNGSPAPTFKPLRRVGSASSGSSSSGSSSGGSSSSGRLSSPPAPIPGRHQPRRAGVQLVGGRSGYGPASGGLADAAADSPSGGSVAPPPAAVTPAAAAAAAAATAAGDEEPSFRDSWLAEGEQEAERSAAAQRQRRRAAAPGAGLASSIELRPHRSHGHHQRPRSKPAAGAQPAIERTTAALQAAAPSGELVSQQQPAQQQALQQQVDQQQQQQAQQQQQQQQQHQQEQQHQQQQQAQQQQQQQQQGQPGGHYLDVVRSVQQDVLSRSGGDSSGSGGSAGDTPACAAGSSAPAAGAPSSDGEGEFVPIVPRQRRPLGSAQAAAARRRQEEEQEEEEAAAAAAEAAAAQLLGQAGGEPQPAAGADADQQRQWAEFWHQHYAYYGCYPGESTWQADGAATADAASQPAQPGGMAPGALGLHATLPPPPAPPSPPPVLSAAAWACQPPAHAAEQPAGSGEGAEGSWVKVPSSLLARYQLLEWEAWQRSYGEWQALWQQYKEYWAALYSQQQQELEAQQAADAVQEG